MTHHHHNNNNEINSNLTFNEKMAMLLEHWIKHNDDHAGTYQTWAKRSKENNLGEVAELILQASKITLTINEKFYQALEKIS